MQRIVVQLGLLIVVATFTLGLAAKEPQASAANSPLQEQVSRGRPSAYKWRRECLSADP